MENSNTQASFDHRRCRPRGQIQHADNLNLQEFDRQKLKSWKMNCIEVLKLKFQVFSVD